MPSNLRWGGLGPLSTASSSQSLAPGVPLAACSSSDTNGRSEPSSPLPPPSPGPAPALAPSSSPRPSLLTRLGLPLSLPLRNRNRNVVDFHVRCDEPYRKYSAGDSVRGCVVLVLVKPLRITHLVVSLRGYVRVLRDPTSVAKAQSATGLPQGGSSRRPQYHGNGLASLFQDEQVLSSEGRLEPGKYEFNFDLVFPDKELPSSIDFERGTISYMVTATITRPTTIAPTSTCERRVMLTETIDVGLLGPPRPRTIFLEPISKRTRRKRQAVQEKAPAAAAVYEVNDLASEADSVERSVVTDDSGREPQADHRPAVPSDGRSELSGESGRSLSTAISRPDLAQLSQVGSSMTSAAKQQVVDDKTITATIELLRAGCLAGDTVSVRIAVQHVKIIKSMTGVIVTLFRQGKMDVSPPPSLFADMNKDEARRLDKEETYPRSRTGLGGLSLSSTNSTSVFRKDLDQNVAPLIIDPATLQASVTVSVRLPDDAFPTIKNVPGDMISFKYHVEVVVDLGGRLASQLQGGQSTSRFGPYGTAGSEPGGSTYAPQRAANIADTAQLRREKGVISVSMETVVGTMDSSKGRKNTGKSTESRTVRVHHSDEEEAAHAETGNHNGQSPRLQFSPQSQDYQFTPPPGAPPAHPHQPPHPMRGSSQRDYTQTNGYHHEDAAPSYIPPPQIPNEHGMSEKERIRQAETRLLPSQPGPAATPSSPADDDIYDAEDAPQRRGSGGANASSAGDAAAGPSAPTEEELSSGQPAEDKQELERQRLMNEASAPPEFPDDMDRRAEGSSSREHAHADAEPSAPTLGDDGDDFGAAANPQIGAEQLPAYER